MGSTVGRCTAAPSALVNSAFVAGFGDVRLAAPVHRLVPEQVLDRADVVVEGDPAQVLLARADPSAEAELERQQHPVEGAAVGGEDDPGPQVHHPDPGLLGGGGGGLPGHAHPGGEVVAGR